VLRFTFIPPREPTLRDRLSKGENQPLPRELREVLGGSAEGLDLRKNMFALTWTEHSSSRPKRCWAVEW